jgi:16S rRNA processing protein RimM
LRSNLPPITTEDEFYIEDLKGLKVIDLSGNHIANITNIANYGGGDIVEVQFITSGKIEMLPFTKELFPEITKNHAVLTLKA